MFNDYDRICSLIKGCLEEADCSDIGIESVTINLDTLSLLRSYSADIQIVLRWNVRYNPTELLWFRVLLNRIVYVLSRNIGATICDFEFKIWTLDIYPIRVTINMSDIDNNFIVKEKETMPTTMPKVVEIIHRTSHRGELFTVRWSDNTSTTVKRHDPDVSDEYSAFLFALGKKIFGNKGNARKFIAEKKAIFENRVAADSARRAEQKARMNMEKNPPKNAMRCGYVLPVFDEDEIPCCVEEMVSRAIFKKNRR